MRLTLQQIFKIRTIPLDRIREFVPPKQGVRESSILNYLVIIGANPMLTATRIKALANTNSPNNAIINYMVELKLIEQKKKSYWVTQLHAWRIDTVYQISNQGKNCLNKLFSPIFDSFEEELTRGNSEITAH